MLEGTLSVWHAVRVWSVSIWTRRPTAALTSLLPLATPPLRLQRLHNALWQSWLLLALRKHRGYTDKPFAQLWRERKVTTTFGTAVTRVCQEYRKMQTERSCLLECKAESEHIHSEYEHGSKFSLVLFNSLQWIAGDKFALVAWSSIKPPHK